MESVSGAVPLGLVFFWLCGRAGSCRPRSRVRALRETRGAWPCCGWKLGRAGGRLPSQGRWPFVSWKGSQQERACDYHEDWRILVLEHLL